MKDWNSYFLQFENLFSVVKNKKVLDIACGLGLFWPILMKYDPESIEGLDPDTRWKIDNNFSHIVIHRKSYDDFLPNNNYDVILCFGLIYKLSDPTNLIEKLANSNAKYIIIENIMHYDCSSPVKFIKTTHHNLGDLTYNHSYKKIPWALDFPPKLIQEAFNLLGYKLVNYADTTNPKILSKKETCVMLFEKI